jgi:hypothetical protein
MGSNEMSKINISSVDSLVDLALDIAAAERETKRQLKRALEENNPMEALRLARNLVGLEESRHAEGLRTHSR